MPADDDDRHDLLSSPDMVVIHGRWQMHKKKSRDSGYFPFTSRAKAANCFKYFRTGCAGVPQKATPLPRRTLLGSTPPCPPSITPSSMRACSPVPTCPPITTLL